MFRSLLIVSIVALLLPLAPAAPVPRDAGKGTPYFPTQKGTRWTYRSGEREETFVVTAVVEKDGAKIVSVGREEGGRATPVQQVGLTRDGVFVLDKDGRKDDRVLGLLGPSAKPGDQREVEGGGVLWKRVVGGREKVKVPAGTFEALRVEHTFTLTGSDERPDVVILVYTEWYAPGIGLIREASPGIALAREASGDEEVGVLVSFTPGKG